MEAATTEPQEDFSCSLIEELLVAGGLLLASAISLLSGTRSLLIEELSAVGCLLLASAISLLSGTSGLPIEELSAAGCLLLASTSGPFLLDETEAMLLICPHFVDGPLPIPVRAVRVREWHQQQQSGTLLVFADGSLKPIFVANRSTKGVREGGIVAFVLVEQPLGGAWGGLQPLNTQPRGRIGEAG